MYSNLAKGGAFPLVVRVSSKPRCSMQFQALKDQTFPSGSRPKPSLNTSSVQFFTLSCCFNSRPHKVSSFMRTSYGIKCSPVGPTRSFGSTLRVFRVGEGGGFVRGGKSPVWLRTKRVKEGKVMGKVGKTINCSWEQSVERLEKVDSSSSRVSEERLVKGLAGKGAKSSWPNLTDTVPRGSSNNILGTRDGRKGVVVKEAEVEEAEEELDDVDYPKWERKKLRYPGMNGKSVKPQLQRWNKRESWSGRTGKEATESTVPKMVGEWVYGVGPVLAALSAGRREFYALYIQEGVDLSGNNRKKKDKKGFEKVLRMAENIGLDIKQISKHDLNMVVDNRPHQGLVLDASPLEMVKITELDPVSLEEEKGSLWVALDEVTDPQNLGAIIRSAYFFGVTGVVLCAKNSAPLSGVVSKASAGSLELMEIRYCKNMMQFLISSADNGWRVLGGSVAPKAVPLNEIAPGSQPTVLVLGSEGTGLRPLVERSCTQLVRIPGNIPVDVILGDTNNVEAEETNLVSSSKEFQSFLAVESLNVSVAAGVLIHHLIGNNQIDHCRISDD